MTKPEAQNPPQNLHNGFNPNDHMMKLQGKDYLPVAPRMAWAHAEHPKGWSSRILASEHTSWEEPDPRSRTTPKQNRTVREYWVRVRISFANGAFYEDEGSETNIDFPAAYREKAITKALGRALAQAGYGTLYAPEFDETATLDRKAGVDSTRDTSTDNNPDSHRTMSGVRVVDTPVDLDKLKESKESKNKKVKALPEEDAAPEPVASGQPVAPQPQEEPPKGNAQGTPKEESSQQGDKYAKMDSLALATVLRTMVEKSEKEHTPEVQAQISAAIATANQAHKVERASLLPLGALADLVRSVEQILSASSQAS